ncbi:response regulator [Alienimonas chondri]|uniref:Response regulator rcp1 n=1 Tax=Alienimonas chondri TaxID=2681879 RepID=A0ABX1V8H5_9PLAN|nr:response regulator [Alienimonas chondri]NNJ24296.1 Response regulator rcp1 [Alienimonas chondri]
MPSPHPRPTRFLLAEDDDDHAALVARTFAQQEPAHSLVRVKDGEAAMRLLTRQSPYETAERPEVVLLDLNLPRLSGHEVLAAMKADAELRMIPVVILTSSADEGDRTRAYQHYANSYVVKPLNFEQFRQMVRDLSDYWSGWDARAASPSPN